MPRVFFPPGANDARYNIRSAEEHGTPVFLEKDAEVFNPQDVYDSTEAQLERVGFDPEKDFIALTGPFIETALVLAATLQRYPKLRILLFSAGANHYRVRSLERR